jgi:hemerythrin-like domain-containing protein
MDLIAPQIESSLYNYMLRLHHHHEDLYAKLMDAMTKRLPDARRTWSELDESLRAHMDTEERYVLPVFARVDREEALGLVREHGRIREQLLEIGIAIDLHEATQAERFIALLRGHAERENKLMYRWAAQDYEKHHVARPTAP